MKKQKLQLIILLVVLVIVGGGYFGLKAYNDMQKAKGDIPEGDLLFSIKKDDVIEVSFDYDGTDYVYVKENGTWYPIEDKTLDIIQSRLMTASERFANLVAHATIPDVTDLSVYGLDKPVKTFGFKTADESYEFIVGDQNQITGHYYICEPGSNTVYTVTAITVTQFEFTVEDVIRQKTE